MVELIRNGPSELKREKRLDSEEQWKSSADHLVNYQKACLARLAADIAESLPEFPHLKKMLDLGGGPGLAGMAILQRHPRLEGVLCDMPSMVNVAREQAQAKGLQERMAYIPGDYNQVDWGEGYDLIWASHALYYVQNFSHFFTRIYNSLNPDGVFVSLHEGLSNERTFPPYHVLARISLALEGQDVSFSQGFIAEKMRESGFTKIDSQSLELSMGPVWLDIARKSEANKLVRFCG
jgi:predicted TPR repeat methyltransferase